MENIILITIMSVFGATAAMALPSVGDTSSFYGKKGNLRIMEVVDVYEGTTPGVTVFSIDVTTWKWDSHNTREVTVYYNQDNGTWWIWGANSAKLKKQVNKFMKDRI